ncbi:DUF4162 domain-containing protein, partial [Salmonella enterica]|nr:DUF4162 domain-containing protein [Salmonella enterica]
EAVCDDITLISNSRAVLSGSVAEVKQRFKRNVFSIRFTGDSASLATDGSAITVEAMESGPGGVTRATVSPADASMTANDLIRHLLGRVTLVSFEEVLPTMEEIFIKTVEGANK